jgi:hypothetical protein
MLKQFAVICVFTIAIASMCRSQSIDPAALQEASIKMRAAINAGQVRWRQSYEVPFKMGGTGAAERRCARQGRNNVDLVGI